MEKRQPDSISDKILGKIKLEGIRPEASWKFVMRKTLLWTGIVFAGILAGISFSLVIFSLFSIDQGILQFAPKRLFSPAVFRSLPFLWIGFLMVFVTLAVREYHETGHGYRHRTLFVALSTLCVVIMIGTAFHLLHVGERSDAALRNALPRTRRSSAHGRNSGDIPRTASRPERYPRSKIPDSCLKVRMAMRLISVSGTIPSSNRRSRYGKGTMSTSSAYRTHKDG